MIIKEVLQKANFNKVYKILEKTFGEYDQYDDYKAVYFNLLNKPLAQDGLVYENHMVLVKNDGKVIYGCFCVKNDSKFIDILSQEPNEIILATFKQDLDSVWLEDSYDLDFLPWDQWLQLPIADISLRVFDINLLAATILYEMTFVSFSEDVISSEKDFLDDLIKDFKEQIKEERLSEIHKNAHGNVYTFPSNEVNNED